MVKGCLDTLFVGHGFTNASIEGCLFRLTRQLPLAQHCTEDMLFWLLPVFDTVSSCSKIATLANFSGCSIALSFMGVTAHFMTSIVLSYTSTKDPQDKHPARNASYSYFLNPLLVASCLMSPVPSMLHLLIVVANHSALKGWKLLLYACLSLLVSGHSAFICAAPAYMILLRRTTATQHAQTASRSASKGSSRYISALRWFVTTILVLATLAAVLPYMELSGLFSTAQNGGFLDVCRRFMRFMFELLQKVSNYSSQAKRLNYEPCANFLWYMDVQVFSRFSDYFLFLIPNQPFLFVLPLLVRMSPRRPLHTVCDIDTISLPSPANLILH